MSKLFGKQPRDHRRVVVDMLRMIADQIEEGNKTADPMDINFSRHDYAYLCIPRPPSMELRLTICDLGVKGEIPLQNLVRDIAERAVTGEG